MNRIGVYGAVLAGLLLNGWAAWGGVTRYVDCNATGLNDGTSWPDAFNELTNAINTVSANGDEIWIAQGTYYPTGPTDNDRTKYFNLDTVSHAGSLGIYGGFTNGMASKDERNWTNYPVVLSGDIQRDGIMTNNSYHVMYNTLALPATCTVDGVTIALGYANGTDWAQDKGGAFYHHNNGSRLILTNCMICTNYALLSGGGVYSYDYLTMENCVVMANSNVGVAAVHNSTIRNCTFKRNVTDTTTMGAGLAVSTGPTLVDNCRFFDNKVTIASSGGGGVSVSAVSGALVTNCVFSGNICNGPGGGLICNDIGTPLIADCIFSGNMAPNYGGAVEVTGYARATFQNCMFCGNECRVSAVRTGNYSPACTLNNCLVVGNNSPAPANGTEGVVSIKLTTLDRGTSTTTVNNCTFAGNNSPGPIIRNMSTGPLACTMTNSILWANTTGSGYAEIYNNAGCTSYVYYTAFTATNNLTGTVLGAGCMAADPLFAGIVATGAWTAAGNYDPETGQTILSNANASWTPGAFAGLTVQSDTNSYRQFYIVTNAANTMLIWCGTNAIPTNGAAYRVYNYHEKSKLGRWTPLGWVRDTVQSPCIDAGDPASAFALEPHPNGARINMGAYGNTDEASQTAINSGTIIRFR